MSSAQRHEEKLGQLASRYFLRLAFILIILIALNLILIVAHFNLGYLTITNILASSIFLFISSTLGDDLDKKLILWIFRIYRWMINRGLIEDSYYDEDLTASIQK